MTKAEELKATWFALGDAADVAEAAARDARGAAWAARDAYKVEIKKQKELKKKVEVATQALEDIMVDPTWGLEHETYMRCRDALQRLKE